MAAIFCGHYDRATVSTLTLQPFFIYNLPKGWYLRSTAIWTYDMRNDTFFIPVGLGAGKTWRVGKDIFNAFGEPQFTTASGCLNSGSSQGSTLHSAA